MKIKFLSELFLRVGLIFVLSIQCGKTDVGSGSSSFEINAIDYEPEDQQFASFVPKNLYLDINNCYDCQYGQEYQTKIMMYECSMHKDDPVSIYLFILCYFLSPIIRTNIQM